MTQSLRPAVYTSLLLTLLRLMSLCKHVHANTGSPQYSLVIPCSCTLMYTVIMGQLTANHQGKEHDGLSHLKLHRVSQAPDYVSNCRNVMNVSRYLQSVSPSSSVILLHVVSPSSSVIMLHVVSPSSSVILLHVVSPSSSVIMLHVVSPILY